MHAQQFIDAIYLRVKRAGAVKGNPRAVNHAAVAGRVGGIEVNVKIAAALHGIGDMGAVGAEGHPPHRFARLAFNPVNDGELLLASTTGVGNSLSVGTEKRRFEDFVKRGAFLVIRDHDQMPFVNNNQRPSPAIGLKIGADKILSYVPAGLPSTMTVHVLTSGLSFSRFAGAACVTYARCFESPLKTGGVSIASNGASSFPSTTTSIFPPALCNIRQSRAVRAERHRCGNDAIVWLAVGSIVHDEIIRPARHAGGESLAIRAVSQRAGGNGVKGFGIADGGTIIHFSAERAA